MEGQKWKVDLNIYDLSGGLAKNMSRGLVGIQIDGIWHTGIVVYGKEYYFGGGICVGPPKQTPYGMPIKTERLGETELPQEIFTEFLKSISSKFSIARYDLFSNNCNNFTDECAHFLIGEGIPKHITGLPQEFLRTPFGSMMRNMLGGMEQNIQRQSSAQNMFNLPNSFEGSSNPQQMNFSPPPQTVTPVQTPNTNSVNVSDIPKNNGTVIEINNMAEFNSLVKKDEFAIVDFFSFTCPPCMKIKPVYEAMCRETSLVCPFIRFYKVDTRQARDVAQAHGIQAIPTFIGFKKGILHERFQGADQMKLKNLITTFSGLAKTLGLNAQEEKKSSGFKIFDPNQLEPILFATSNLDTPITKIKEFITKYELEKSNSNELNILDELKAKGKENISATDKKIVLDLISKHAPRDNAEKLLPFYDLVRILILDKQFMQIFYTYHFGMVTDVINNFIIEEKYDKESNPRTARSILFRLLTNLSAQSTFHAKLRESFSLIVTSMNICFTKFANEKTTLTAIYHLLYNVLTNKEKPEISMEIMKQLIGGVLTNLNDESNENGAIAGLAILCLLSTQDTLMKTYIKIFEIVKEEGKGKVKSKDLLENLRALRLERVNFLLDDLVKIVWG